MSKVNREPATIIMKIPKPKKPEMESRKGS